MKSTITMAVGVAFMLHASLGVAQPPVGNAPLDRGKQVYDYWCLPCHGEGLGLPGFAELPGTQQLRIKYRDVAISPLLTERTDLVPDFVKAIVRQGVSFMPQFRKTEISDAQIAQIGAYIVSAARATP